MGRTRTGASIQNRVERIATPDGSLEWATTVQPFGVTLLEITRA